jgi:hypothetical protein
VAQDARFDIITSETHEAVMTITSHPVEKGADVVDHARPDPERITIEGYVSNKPSWSNPDVEKVMSFQPVPLAIPAKSGGAPIFTPGGLGQAVSGAVGSLLGKDALPTSIRALAPSGTWQDRARAMYTKLAQARLDRARITVVASAVQTIDDMLIERLAVPRTTADGNGLLFQIDLLKVRIVASEQVTAPDPAELRGVPAASKGSQAAKDADAKKADKEKTLAARGFDAAANKLRALQAGDLF